MTASSDLLLFHFVDHRLLDGRRVPADGDLLRAFPGGQLAAHATPSEALSKAEGETICVVTLRDAALRPFPERGWISRERMIIKRIDARPLLRTFALHCARDTLLLWDELSVPDLITRYLESPSDSLAQQVRDFFPEVDDDLYAAGSPLSYAVQAFRAAANPGAVYAAKFACMHAAMAHGAMAGVEAYADACYGIDPGDLYLKVDQWPRAEVGSWGQSERDAWSAANDRLEADFNRMAAEALNLRVQP